MSRVKQLKLTCDEAHGHSLYRGCFSGTDDDLLIAKLSYELLMLLNKLKDVSCELGLILK